MLPKNILFKVFKIQESNHFFFLLTIALENLDLLTNIIIRWRRLELDSWQQLLEEKFHTFRHKAIKEVSKKLFIYD